MYYYVPHTGMFAQSTRAQSVARSTFTPAYSAPLRQRAFDDEIIHRPFRPVIHTSYDTSGSENFTRSEINRELLMTSNAMEDNYDIVNMSRNKDKDVLSRAQRAIVNTELHSTPRSAVAARRVMGRGHSTPPEYTPKIIPKTEQVVPPPKTYRGVEGFQKGKNILSWEYKLDALVNPDDLIMVPRSLTSVKSQVREVQDKMDRHRQLMDRYLNQDTGLSVDDMRA